MSRAFNAFILVTSCFVQPGEALLSTSQWSNVGAATQAATEALGARQPDDGKLPNGITIDRACPKEMAEKLSKAYAELSTQVARCKQVLGFPELEDLPTGIRETSITCAPDKNSNLMASNQDLSFRNQLGTLAARVFDRLFVNPKLRHPKMVLYDGFLGLAEREKAPVLFHETLHSYETLNTSWHNAAPERGLGCFQSMFEDRVYFLEAACFPYSDNGSELYHIDEAAEGAGACQNVCMSALTKVDEDLPPGLPAVPYPTDKARETCKKVSRVRTAARDIESWSKEVDKRTSPLSDEFKAEISKIYWSPAANFATGLAKMRAMPRSPAGDKIIDGWQAIVSKHADVLPLFHRSGY